MRELDTCVTGGTQTHASDGMAALLVATEGRAKELSTRPEIDIQFVAKTEMRTHPSLMPEAPAFAVRKLLDRTGLTMADMAVVKNHNPFAVNDVIFAELLDYDWREMNNTGCPLVWGHPQGPTLTRVLIEALGRGGGSGRRVRADLRLCRRRRGHRIHLQGHLRGEGNMTQTLREPTLQTLGLGTVLDVFKNGRLPADPAGLVDEVFGNGGKRGSLVISGASGIVGAGKTMQLGSRLHPYGVPVVALDLPGAPDGLGAQYPGLVQAFGREDADAVMASIIRMSYDGKSLPDGLKALRPRFLLEAIPEILDVKKAHYQLFREAFPDIAIRSVTSGFPSSELGVGIAHPAFPHEINKIWEVVEPEPSAVTQLLWALGLIPIPVSDHWSFVLDVLFCGITLAGLRYHEASNMPFWKIDKLVRKEVGPNPFRAHDVIGAKGADFLTWSCLHHLTGTYGEVFRPTTELEERKETGQSWYPPNHFRPLVDWRLSEQEE